MTITLYKSSAEPNAVDKSSSLTLVGEFPCSLSTTNNDLLNPTVRVLLNRTPTSTGTIFPEFNYAYIDEFKRYYYRASCEWVGGFQWAIGLSEDVLMSHKDDILAKRCFAVRLEDVEGPTMIKDEELVAEATQCLDIESVVVPIASGKHGFGISSTKEHPYYTCVGMMEIPDRYGLDLLAVSRGTLQPAFNERNFSYKINLYGSDDYTQLHIVPHNPWIGQRSWAVKKFNPTTGSWDSVSTGTGDTYVSLSDIPHGITTYGVFVPGESGRTSTYYVQVWRE